MDKRKLAYFLRELANAIDHMDERQIDGLIASIKEPTAIRAKREGAKKQAKGAIDIEAVLADLRTATSREAALLFIQQSKFSRNELVAAAKKSDVYFTKSDTVSTLTTKIIEATVGSRLNSLAIRGEKGQ